MTVRLLMLSLGLVAVMINKHVRLDLSQETPSN